MEEHTEVPQVPEASSRIPNFLKKHVDGRRKMLLVLSGAILLFSAGLTYMLISPQKTNPPSSLVVQQVPTITTAPTAQLAMSLPSPTVTSIPTIAPKASKSGAFLSYHNLSGEEKFAVAYNFTDKILTSSLAYPPGYFMESYKADNDHKIAELFFTKNAKDVETLRYVVNCVLDNRKNPSGLCVESIVGDVAVSILPYEPHDNILSHDGNPLCQRDIDTPSRVLFSCETAMSVSAADKGMSYTLYFLQENPLQVKVSSRDPKTHAHLIRSILSSVTNHLQ